MQRSRMVRQLIASMLAISWMNNSTAFSQNPPTLLSGILRKGCFIEDTAGHGLYPVHSISINCGCDFPVRVVHPSNLTGIVNIRTAEEALGYVRYFTNLHTWDAFVLAGAVEVRPESDGADAEQYVVVRDRDFRRLSRAKASRYEGTDGPYFVVERSVVQIDQRVYTIREWVYSDGRYEVRDKKIVVRRATDIGITHFGRV